ncbi:MAG: hypothetical protein ACYDER_18840 [Ktedonobacteraceae bacterium]
MKRRETGNRAHGTSMLRREVDTFAVVMSHCKADRSSVSGISFGGECVKWRYELMCGSHEL